MPDLDRRHFVAYFCAEFALSDDLPIYAGGLGVLAGDYLKEAADQNANMVAVGLLYHQGYFRQHISQSGNQIERYADFDLERAGLTQLKDRNHRPYTFTLPYKNRQLHLYVWHLRVGHIPVYLLDSDHPDNANVDRDVTQRLYEGDQHIRIKQEYILGVGGARLLNLLQINPDVYHLNEGHSAFAIFEIARQFMSRDAIGFDQAWRQAHHRIVFTNHTIVAAGNDVFPTDDVLRVLSTYFKESELPVRKILSEGADPDQPESFSMTTLALNAAGHVNAVSRLHGHMASNLWPHHRFSSVTNGVHMPTWIAPNIQSALSLSQQHFNSDVLDSLNPHLLWDLHQQNKRQLLQTVYEHTGAKLNPDALTIVWARRFAMYKRPLLILEHFAMLRRLAANGQRLQLIFAGKAHPMDEPAHDVINRLHRTVEQHGLSDWVVFVPNYRLDLARQLVSGADVWLNTPIRGQEASGTSGMKAGANGALLISTNDGWMPEVNWHTKGWIIPDAKTDVYTHDLLAKEILPLFEDRTDAGLPAEWLWRMRETMRVCWSQFSTTRMLREYQQKLYQPVFEYENS